MLVALIVIAISLARMVPAPAWLGWYTLAFILLFDSAYAWSCEPPHLCHAAPKGCLLGQESEECRPLHLVGSGIALAALEILCALAELMIYHVQRLLPHQVCGQH